MAPAETATHTDFESLFVRVGAIVLEEPDSAPITGIRALAPGLDGGVVVVDKGRSQTRLHGSDGRLQRIIGRFGGGPGEFREPMDARFDHAGRLYVADADGSRVTRFHPDFGYDTAYAAPAMGIYEIDWVPNGLLVTTWNELGGPNPWFQVVVDTADGAALAQLGPIDSLLWRVPYWRSFNRPLGSGDATLMVTGNYLLYPFAMYDGAGRFIKEFGSPPPSYRPPEELEPGAFIGLEGQRKMNDWLRSHTRVSRLDIYRDSLIFAVHAVPDPTPADRSEWLDKTVDIYDRNGEKIWVDVPLPGLKVLRTEQYLFILETMPPYGPWTIGKYEVVVGEPAGGADEPLTAVFQELIELHTWPDAEYLCLGISAETGAGWHLQDPPRAVVEAFEGHPVPVVPASECEVTVDGNRHVTTDRPAQAFWLESVELTGLSGEVRARYHVHGLYAGSFECAVMKGTGSWEAECRQVGVS